MPWETGPWSRTRLDPSLGHGELRDGGAAPLSPGVHGQDVVCPCTDPGGLLNLSGQGAGEGSQDLHLEVRLTARMLVCHVGDQGAQSKVCPQVLEMFLTPGESIPPSLALVLTG